MRHAGKKKHWGQSPKDEGRGEERKKGGGKMKQRTRELAERKLGKEESEEERRDIAGR